MTRDRDAAAAPTMSISQRVRMARTDAGISCAQLAREVGVRPSAAVQWEAAAGTRPTVESMSRIAIITRVNFEWLATGRGSKQPASTNATPAIALIDFAQNTYEERLLRAGRKVPLKVRDAFLQFIEQSFR